MVFNNGITICFYVSNEQGSLGALRSAGFTWTYPISVTRVVTIAGCVAGQKNAIVLAYSDITASNCKLYRCNYVQETRKYYHIAVCLIGF